MDNDSVLTIMDVLRFYDERIRDRDREQFGVICPFHNDHNPSARVNIRNNVFSCFSSSCNAIGLSPIKLVMWREQMDEDAARRYIDDFIRPAPSVVSR